MFVYIFKQEDFVSILLFKIPMPLMIFHPGNPLKQEEYVSFQVKYLKIIFILDVTEKHAKGAFTNYVCT